MLTRRRALATIGAGLVGARAVRAAGKPTNVLLVVADDLNNIASVYGDPIVKTPNLERLARRGVVFDHAYCQFPLCQPSRASMLSGRRPETTRVWTLETPTRQFLGDTVFLPELFRKQGYFSAHAGKIYHTGDHCEDPRSWDIEVREKSKGPKESDIVSRGRSEGAPGFFFEWNVLKTRDADTQDGAAALQTVDWMERVSREKRPFFLGAGFRRPHEPFAAPQKYFDMYPPERMTIPKGSWPVVKAAINHPIPPKPLTDDEVRRQRSAYYACITFMDAQLGVLLDAMDRLKLWDSTAVVFLGDNGYHLGEHGGMWHKNSLFEESARVPLLVAAPEMRAAGKRSPRLVELVDLYPTLTDICGLSPPDGLEGTSLRPLLDDPQRAWKKAAFTMQGRGRTVDYVGKSVRTERWRYIEWDEGRRGIELYDEVADPAETQNLAGKNSAEAELRQLLHAGWRDALPPRRG